MTIASARHADLGANLWQRVVVSVRRILETLVAVNDQGFQYTSFVFSKAFINVCKTSRLSFLKLIW